VHRLRISPSRGIEQKPILQRATDTLLPAAPGHIEIGTELRHFF
jgi:hypothetical protein